jgi:hypothetical protein
MSKKGGEFVKISLRMLAKDKKVPQEIRLAAIDRLAAMEGDLYNVQLLPPGLKVPKHRPQDVSEKIEVGATGSVVPDGGAAIRKFLEG